MHYYIEYVFKKLIFVSFLFLIFIFMLGVGGSAWYLRDEFSGEAVIPWLISESPKGQKSLLTLADGSRIYLNSASSISYPETFKADEREVVLSGEAFFEVTKDEKRPFIVRSGNITTRVLGTSFNVQAFNGKDIHVTVASGTVQVESNKNPVGKAFDYVILSPNEQVVYNAGTGLVTKTVDSARFMAWKNQTLYFENSALEEVATQLERWYNVSIGFNNEKIKYCRITGQYKDMDVRSVLKSIQYMYRIDYVFSDQNNIMLSGKGCNHD